MNKQTKNYQISTKIAFQKILIKITKRNLKAQNQIIKENYKIQAFKLWVQNYIDKSESTYFPNGELLNNMISSAIFSNGIFNICFISGRRTWIQVQMAFRTAMIFLFEKQVRILQISWQFENLNDTRSTKIFQIEINH